MTETAAQRSTVECTLSLAGRDFDLEAVTDALGVQPTKVWRQRRQALAERTDLPNLEWQLTVGPECWSIFDDGVQALATLMAGREERVRDLGARLGLKVAVVVYAVLVDERPAYVLSPSSLRWLAEVGAELSIEIADRRNLD
jgi:hypothetical protein